MDIKEFVLEKYKDYKYISIKLMVGEYVMSKGKSVYHPSKEMLGWRRKLACQASSSFRKLVKQNKIEKYGGKSYKVKV